MLFPYQNVAVQYGNIIRMGEVGDTRICCGQECEDNSDKPAGNDEVRSVVVVGLNVLEQSLKLP